MVWVIPDDEDFQRKEYEIRKSAEGKNDGISRTTVYRGQRA
jgi:hypothetical protein